MKNLTLTQPTNAGATTTAAAQPGKISIAGETTVTQLQIGVFTDIALLIY